MITFRSIANKDKELVQSIITESWGSCRIVSKGKVHDPLSLPGFLAEDDGLVKGLIVYRIDGNECEIILLESFLENRGLGTAFMDRVCNSAREAGCKRIFLITTNDNTKAIRFYQKRGFTIAAIHIDSMKLARQLKPEIPPVGFDGIPIRDEIEFVKDIS